MTYTYAWYEMFGLMLAAGIAIFLAARAFDWGLLKLLDIMQARRDRKATVEYTAEEGAFAEQVRRATRQFRG